MTEPLSKRLSSRLGIWAFILFVGVVATLTGLWFVGADMVRNNIAALARDMAADGGHFSAKSLRITGFPLSFEVHMTGIRLAGTGPKGPWEWQADKVRAKLAPWRAANIQFNLEGRHHLRVHAARVPLDLEIRTKDAPGQLRRGADGAPDIFEIAPRAMTIREAITRQDITIDEARLQLFHYKGRRNGLAEPSAGILLDLKNLGLPKKAQGFLAPQITRLGMEIMVLGDLPTPVDRVRMGRWSRSGGTLEIKKIDLAWGPATMTANGTFSLDDRLQPEASLSARITGHEQTVDALVKSGIIRAQAAEGIKLVLTIMARRPAPDKEVEIRVPVTIQSRALYLGPARLFRIPLIRW